MIRFQCPHCRSIIAAEQWTPNAMMTCADCGKEVQAPESRFSLGVVLGDFLLEKKLGAGGMGIVFLAHQISLDRPAAIKVLNPEYSKEADSVRNFIREARSAAKLNHPNIVQAYAVGEDDGIFYFAMEYVDGETMKETLKRQGKIEFKEAARAVMQIADGLDAAWREQKLIHHDIKPDNIMHCSNDRYKLSDLGLSQVFGEDADDDSNEVLGTPQYISPEQLTGVVTDTRSDIYSLGATFYHLVTGQFPYTGKDTDEIALQHVQGTLVPPNQVNPMLPKELNDVIVKMMAKKPDERYQDCGEIVKVLRDYLEPARRATGGLNGGLNGGMANSGKLDSGSAAPSLRLENASKAQTIQPPGQSKISLHLAPANAPEPKPAAETPIAKPAAAAPVVIKLHRPDAAPKPAVAAPVATPAAAPVAAPPKAQPIAKPAAGSQPQLKLLDEDEFGDAAEKPQPDDAQKADEGAKETKETKETKAPEDAKKPGRNTLTIVFAAAALCIVGLAAWLILRSPEELPPPKPATPTATASATPIEVPDVTIAEYVGGAPAAAEQPAEPERSFFERETERLSTLSMSDPQDFLREWPAAANSLTAATDAEKKTLAKLETIYVNLDERLNVFPARKPLLDAYRQAETDKIQRVQAAARAAKIAAEDAKNTERAALSPENYRSDLKRRVMLLDHAMIRAARSGSDEDWDAFINLVEAAQKEPRLYADDPQRRAIAEKLADYADKIALLAEQGQMFTAFLASGQAGGKTCQFSQTIGGKNVKFSVSIESTSKDSISYSITLPGGEAVSGTFNARTAGAVELAQAQVACDALGGAVGRRDQFFYYMAYNGFLKEDVSFAAPSTFWENNVGHLMTNYLRRAIFIASPEELEALRQEFGDWPDFKRAEKYQP